MAPRRDGAAAERSPGPGTPMKHLLILSSLLCLSFQAPLDQGPASTPRSSHPGSGGHAAAAPCQPTWVSTFGGAAGQPSDAVLALVVHDDGAGGGPALFAGGSFIEIGGLELPYAARWNGTSWSGLSSGLNGEVRALAVHDDGLGSGPALYAAGEFTVAGGVAASRIARWDGSAWSALGSGLSGTAHALVSFDDGTGSGPALYVGGAFTHAGGIAVQRVARWDGSAWHAVGGGVQGTVRSLAGFDDGSGNGPELYAGGISLDGLDGQTLLKWNGAAWSQVGSGITMYEFYTQGVLALVVHDDGMGGGPALYAGGDFYWEFSSPVDRVARWDGTTWSTVGGGTNLKVEALASFDDGTGSGPALYAGGRFRQAGGVNASRIARWDGAAWSPLGAGLDDSPMHLTAVQALASHDGGPGGARMLYAGGTFTTSPAGDGRLAAWGGCVPYEPGTPYCFGDGAGTPCPCGNGGATSRGCLNSTGNAARLTAGGTPSLGANDLSFTVSDLPPLQPTLLFAATFPVNFGSGAPFGDGLLCTAGVSVRLDIRFASPEGSATWGPGLGLGAVGTGQQFQAWYRDGAGSPCGSGFNLSNGYAIGWEP